MTRIFVVVTLLLVVVVGGFYFVFYGRQSLPLPDNVAVLSPAKSLSPFQLQSHHGAVVSHEDFKGAWQFVFFGYIDCPDVCPTTLQTLGDLMASLKRQDLVAPKVWFVSIDPARTSMKRLSDYLTHFNADFVGLSGSEEALKKLTDQWGVYYVYDHGHVQINHASTLFVVNPEGALHALVHLPYNAESLVDTVKALNLDFAVELNIIN